jgi:hypothetical protein
MATAVQSDELARVTITRTEPNDVRDRQIVLSMNGEPLGTLLFGQQVSQEVPPGRHRLKAHNTLFWKNIEVDLRPGDHARFVVINRAGTGTLSLLGVLGVGPLYLTFERQDVT